MRTKKTIFNSELKKSVLKVTCIFVLTSALFMSCTKSNDKFDAKNEIIVVSREEGSGTRGAFIELCGIQQKNANNEKIDLTTDEALITNSTSVMMTTISDSKYSIGYVSLGFLNETVKPVFVDGAEPSVTSIQQGKYKIVRPFNIVTTSKEKSINAQDFINFILSSKGQKIINDNGFIPLKDSSEYIPLKCTDKKIVIAGSSSVCPIMEKLKEAYNLIQPEAKIEIQQSDSTTGINSVIEEICDIGMASRNLKSTETEKGLLSTVIANDGIAIIVNQENPVNELSREMIKDIFTGSTTSWNNIIE